MESDDFFEIEEQSCLDQQPNNINDDIGIFLSLESVLPENRQQEPATKHRVQKRVNFKDPSSSKQITSLNTIIDQQPSKVYQTATETKIRSAINLEGLYETKSCRTKRFIQVSDKTRHNYLSALKGHKEQTSELNINMKTLTKAILRQQSLFHDFTRSEGAVIKNFQKSNANFNSFRELFGMLEEQDDKQQLDETGQDLFKRCQRRINTDLSRIADTHSEYELQRTERRSRTEKSRKYIIRKQNDRIRRLCMRNFSSCKIIREALKSCRMNSHNKIVTMKFLEQVRDGIIRPEQFKNWKGKLDTRK